MDDSTDNFQSALLRWGRFFWISVLLAGTVIAVAGTLAQFLSRGWWGFELATHFTAHWAVLLSLLATGWAIVQRWRWVLVAMVCLAWHVAQLAPLYVSGPIATPEGATRRLVVQNVFTSNQQAEAMLALAQREQPDVLVLIETNDRWVREMKSLGTDYPHTLHQPSRDNFGLSLYSRHPWMSAEVVRLGQAQLPSIVVIYDMPDGPLQILATHTLPPVSAEYSALRNDQLRAIGTYVAARGLPTMVVGDLNTTCWSPVFHDLLEQGNLRNSQRGIGVAPTWTLGLLPGIAIDHVLVTRGVAIGDRRVGPPIGSDHRGVIVDFAVAPVELQ